MWINCLFAGEIPHEIGNLHNLEYLVLENNNFDGVIPAEIFNLSSMRVISLLNNSLSGALPSSPDIRLPNLERLYLERNNFSGTIPSFIFNASKLSILGIRTNSFSGTIPSTIANLRNLQWLDLSFNYLTSSTSELSFLSSLRNCRNLKVIDLTGNQQHGILPSSMGNLSTSLEYIYMPYCLRSGRIPEEIGNLINLITMSLGINKLTGQFQFLWVSCRNCKASIFTRIN